jgi:hypothetical protein
MQKKPVRFDVPREKSDRIREEVFGNPACSTVDRRKALRRFLPIPADGSRVDVYCDGDFIGAV